MVCTESLASSSRTAQQDNLVIVSPMPIRPRAPKLQEASDDIQAELLTIVGKPPSSPFCNVMISPSPVYRTLNPLPHNTSFATAAVFTVVAAAATTATTTKSGASEDVADWHPKQPFMTTRQRSHSVGDDRRLAAATAY